MSGSGMGCRDLGCQKRRRITPNHFFPPIRCLPREQHGVLKSSHTQNAKTLIQHLELSSPKPKAKAHTPNNTTIGFRIAGPDHTKEIPHSRPPPVEKSWGKADAYHRRRAAATSMATAVASTSPSSRRNARRRNGRSRSFTGRTTRSRTVAGERGRGFRGRRRRQARG